MKDKLQSLLIMIFVVGILIVVGMSEKSFAHPNEVYQVYLNGKKIGLIKSEQQLLDLIDKEQTTIKDSFKVDKVYPPTGLNIEKIYTYNEEVKDTVEIYNKIKDVEPFTINAYTVTITYPKNEEAEDYVEEKKPVKIYLFDPEIVKTALHNVAETFIGKDELKNFEDGTQVEIADTGEIITSVFFDESITIKESLVSTENYIYKDADKLTEFLLYGSNSEAVEYEVKEGEDLHKIAEDHELNIAELLIANPKYPNGNALLSPGEVLNVRLINPVVSIVYRKTEVEDTSLNYETEYIEDKSKYTDYTLVQQEGVDGVSRITTDVQYKNGEIYKVNIVKQETIKSPVNRIVVRGSKKYSGWSGSAPTLGDSKLLWPTNVPYVITSKYEYRWGSFHKGIDISGTGWYSPIYASMDGVVIDIHKDCANRGYYGSHCGGGMGNYVKVRNEESGLTFIYGHVSQNIPVKIGQTVTQGQVIGSMAMSGSSTGVHLHFQIEDADGKTYNPCKSGLRC